MLDPAANDLLPPPSSPTISSISSSDLDTESTGSFFHDRSTTLGTLMGVTFPAITFRAPSQHQEANAVAVGVAADAVGNVVGGGGGRRSRKAKKAALVVAAAAERRRRWWRLCRDDESKPSSLGEFLEVERRFGDGAFYGATAELEGVVTQPRNGRVLFADGRVLPPAQPEEGTSTAGALCRFPVSLTGICSGGVG
uniref:Uncharacterized protein n=1 Tax=Davidia involucrata TaxID=16924 RepID=A0A5B7BT29_DAVIN